MSKTLYVGNLVYSISDSELAAIFEPFGEVESAKIVIDRDTNRSRGFGFVQMTDDQAAAAAIEALNGQDHGGRRLTVNEARPRPDRGNGGGNAGGRRY